MGTVTALLHASHLSRRRSAKLRSPRTTDMLLYSWLAVVALVRLTLNSFLAAREINHGFHDVGLAIAEFTVLHFLLVTFLFPTLASMLLMGGGGLEPSRLALASVRLGSLFLTELVQLASRPLSWVIVLFLAVTVVPLCGLPNALPAILTLCLAFLGVLFLASAAGRALGMCRRARGLASAFRFIIAAAMIMLVLANFDFQWDGGSVQLLVYRWRVPLFNAHGGLLAALQPWSPSALIIQGLPLYGLALASASTLLFLLVVRAGYRGRRDTETSTIHIRHARTFASASGRIRSTRSLLFRMELRFLGARAGTIAGAVAAIGFSVWLGLEKQPAEAIALAGCFVIYLCNFGSSVNLLGRDRGALRRHALAGVKWTDIIISKDVAWIGVMTASLAPVITVDAVRVSTLFALSLTLGCASVAFLTVSWGIISSVLYPSAGQRQKPPFVNQVAPFVLCAPVLVVHRNVAGFGTLGFDLCMVLFLGAGVMLSGLLTNRFGETFEKELEGVLERMRAA
jgi:hypothetical protein